MKTKAKWITLALAAVAIILTFAIYRIIYSAKYEALGSRLWDAIEQYAAIHGDPPPTLEALFTANILKPNDIDLARQATSESGELLKYQYNRDNHEASLLIKIRSGTSEPIVWKKQF